MTGYELAERLRRTRVWFKLTATEQALFHELVAICNEKQWPETFKCTNSKLRDSLQISNSTLVTARKKLVKSELIYYQSGKSRWIEGSYSFTTPFPEKQTAKDTPGEHGKGVSDEHGKGTPDEHNSINKHNNKTPPESPKENEIKKDPLHISFSEIKVQLLADEIWKEQTAMQSGISIKFLKILPSQIDLFLQYIIATGQEHSLLTLSDAKRRFFWWWKNQGKKQYEETASNTIVW